MSFTLVFHDESGDKTQTEAPPLLYAVAEATRAREHLPDGVEMGLTFVDDEAMRALNATHRGVDAATDVLSFPLFTADDMERLRDDPDAFPERPILLGDVVIAIDIAARQAADYGHGYERELAFLFVHGLLHLIGYEHGDEPSRRRMRNAEEAILADVGATR